MREDTIHPLIHLLIWNCTVHFQRSAVWYIRTLHGQPAGLRQEEESRVTEPPMQITCTEEFVVRCLTKEEIDTAYEKNTGLLIVELLQR